VSFLYITVGLIIGKVISYSYGLIKNEVESCLIIILGAYF